MSNLLVTIIAIALLILLAIVAAYYGSTSWKQSSIRASSNTLINQREQIKTAALMYKSINSKQVATNLDMLVDENFLHEIPYSEELGTWDSSDNLVYLKIEKDETANEEICQKMQEIVHGDTSYTIPSCGDAEEATDVCCFVE